MAQNFWLASFAFAACFLLTVGISLATARTKTDEELKGLGLFAHAQDQGRRRGLVFAPGRAGSHSPRLLCGA